MATWIKLNLLHGIRAMFVSVLLFASEASAEPSLKNRNLALFKPTWLSPNPDNVSTNFTVDGSTARWPYAMDCPKRAVEDRWQWWLVDLQDVYTIRSFRVTVCCNHDVTNVAVEVSTVDPTTLAGFPAFTESYVCVVRDLPGPAFPNFEATTYACDEPVSGRYVRLVQSNDSPQKNFSVCEFEVYDYYETNLTIGEPSEHNVALGKTTFQSSYLTGSGGLKAVDGILNGTRKEGFCAITKVQNVVLPVWWVVDLGGLYIIDSVRLAPRTDCCQNGIRNFDIEIYTEENPKSRSGFLGTAKDATVCHRQIDIVQYSAPLTFRCDQPIMGRYVRFRKHLEKIGRDSLSLCEVEVFGTLLSDLRTFTYRHVNGTHDISIPGPGKRTALACARLHSQNLVQTYTRPYMGVHFDSGQCSFFGRSEFEAQNVGGASNLTFYEIIYRVL